MKKTMQACICILLALVLTVCFVSCRQGDVWQDATYRQDTELGSGDKTLTVEVKVEEHLVVFTLHTDESTVGAALLENGLIAGEEGQYGLYIKVVNGMTADYDADGHYWSFCINGEYAMKGVDGTPINEGDTYRLEYAK